MSSSATINENVIRWSEIRLPHPERPGELATWKLDGPFALRPYYRVEGTSKTVELRHLDERRDDGTLAGCIYCGASGSFSKRSELDWTPIAVLAVGAIALMWALGWTSWGILGSLALVAYPIWFLWADAPRVEKCEQCSSEFVNFRIGPRP